MQVAGLLWLAGVVFVVTMGCDAPSKAAATLEESLRERSSSGQKIGTLRALEVAKTAHTLALDIHRAPHHGCELNFDEDAAYTYRSSLTLERRSAAGVEARWTEGRTLRQDIDGNLALALDADFRTELGALGERKLRWWLVGDDSYVSDDGRAFYRRDAAFGERSRVLALGRATLQTLLDAASTGWSEAGPDSPNAEDRDAEDRDAASWNLGGERLVCVRPAAAGQGAESGRSPDDGWLRRFRTQVTPLEGTLAAAGDGSRTLEVRWQLEEGSTLLARFSDRLEEGAEPVDAPPASRLVEVERDRSLHGVERLLEELTTEGLIEKPAPEKQAP